MGYNFSREKREAHGDVIKCFEMGFAIQIFSVTTRLWEYENRPSFLVNRVWRVCPKITDKYSMAQLLMHGKLILKHMHGAGIQFKGRRSCALWKSVDDPSFMLDFKYRECAKLYKYNKDNSHGVFVQKNDAMGCRGINPSVTVGYGGRVEAIDSRCVNLQLPEAEALANDILHLCTMIKESEADKVYKQEQRDERRSRLGRIERDISHLNNQLEAVQAEIAQEVNND